MQPPFQDIYGKAYYILGKSSSDELSMLSWQAMTAEDFARFERLLGQRIVKSGGHYWNEVRPCFYRPLLPFEEHARGQIRVPGAARLGGFQHAVPHPDAANSFLNLNMFENVHAYTIDCLDYNRKRQVRLASKQFVIRAITDPKHFKRDAYPVYLSFYERTRYPYGAKRTDKRFFDEWADAVFGIPGITVAGGYQGGALGGVSLSYLVGDTLFYATFFCDTRAMKLYLSDLMLHTVREAAAHTAGIVQIFSGMHKGGNTLDDFYLLRGAKVVRKRAFLHLNVVAKGLIARFMPREHQKLLGNLKGEAENGSG